jgi:hypothetical protein
MGMQQIVSIENMPRWGFGNRVLYFNNLVQLAHRDFSGKWKCIPWEGHQLFEGNMLGLIEEESTHNIEPSLGELFFDNHTVSTRTIFKMKKKYNIPKNTVAIHFRGTDFHQWNPVAILCEDYYTKAINSIEDIDSVILFTDDVSLPSFHSVKLFLEKEGIQYECGDNTSNRDMYFDDFGKMTECDYIISSPSTFCICAGFVGKNKKIIHSKRWMHSRMQVDDKFWVDLYNGGNEDYNIWKLI